MIYSSDTPETSVLFSALRRMLTDPTWSVVFERVCVEGYDALELKAPRFAAALAAREPDLDASAPAVLDVLRTLAPELHPDTPAAQAAPAAPEVDAVPEDPAPDERWDVEWAGELMSQAFRRLAEKYPEGADVPILDDETDELYAASEAEDRERYKRAVDAWIEAALREVGAGGAGSASHPAWDEDWARAEIARAIIYIESRTASGDDPDAAAEWREVLEAVDEQDRERLRVAVRAAVRAAVRELHSEGRLRLPEPKVDPTRTPAESVSISRKPDSPSSSAGSAWGAR